ncbi:MAG: hypothetical protein KTR31_41215 [Myxococcales bacterium]|nr:hypothetical protein [Myxococcales bacterium]
MRVSRIDAVLDTIERSPVEDTADLRWWLVYRYDWRSARPQGRQLRQVAHRVDRLLREHDDEGMREWAAHFLTQWPPWVWDQVIGFLLRAATEDPAVRVRCQAIEGMASRMQFTRPSRMRDRVHATVAEGLSDGEPGVRFWSLYGVGVLQLEACREAVRALTSDPAQIPGWWSVGGEAQDVLVVLDGQPWPDRVSDPGSGPPDAP